MFAPLGAGVFFRKSKLPIRIFFEVWIEYKKYFSDERSMWISPAELINIDSGQKGNEKLII